MDPKDIVRDGYDKVSYTLTYQHWLFMCGYKVLWTRFIPEGDGGHTLVLAQRED
jgi:hypothetical protein